ncbi:imelysin family protein [Mucilaginibacter sp. SP1R1]|uniref:imelysin family protein n=1 Tax=Mucilaginibacter sp. SP1R1 TaxID=2723091 RepID=UPI00161AEE0F|nr:imelysin family protein [Mucilaginibacter sp. SP1R1]MBB6149223.1 putative lipoprotein [Mucilaginibacter sp. SP1R1]
MKNTILALSCIAVLGLSSCSKSNNSTPTNTDGTAEAQVITDFVNVVANPNYIDIQTNASKLNDAVKTLVATPTQANLLATRQAWKDTRAAWESCEGFLFGPVEDNSYDPTMDDWPVNKVDLDALIASNNPLSVSDITTLETTLKGFHAIEYIIFGVGSTKKAADITAREKVYLTSLTESLYNTTTDLRNSWDPKSGNFSNDVLTAGKGSKTYATRQAFFTVLVGSMTAICEEVGTGKMQDPYAARDSTLDESSFSHNSTTDFKNNITGVLNVYLCKYNGVSGSTSLSTLVAAKNAALDNKIKTQINTAIASFSTITLTYEKAIYDQRAQILATQAAIATLQTTLNVDLQAFIKANIKD